MSQSHKPFVAPRLSLIRKQPVSHIPDTELYTGINGIITVAYVVIVFILAFYIGKNFYSFLYAWLLHHYFLKTTIQGAVFFNIHAVFIQRACPDALKFEIGRAHV